MRFSMVGKQVRKSLETDDEREAQRRAMKIWGEASYRTENGLTIDARMFSAVAKEFIDLVKLSSERKERSEYHAKDWPPVIDRYFVGYFGERNIDAIKSADIERYLEWRREYWLSGPGKDIQRINYHRNGKSLYRPAVHAAPSLSRQRGELVILKALFKQAAAWGYCGKVDMPTIRSKTRVDNRRPSFTPEEFEKLISISLSRLEKEHGKQKIVVTADQREYTTAIDDHTLSDRIKLHAHIEIVAGTGMRPSELKNLNWADMVGFAEIRKRPLGQQTGLRIRARGKGKSGVLVPLDGVIHWVGVLWSLFEKELGREPKETDPVFADCDGKRIASFKKGFANLLELAGLRKDHRGVNRTTYSLRHFYISEQIVAGAHPSHVGLNTRTSQQMIEKHYFQTSIERIADKLRPIGTRIDDASVTD